MPITDPRTNLNLLPRWLMVLFDKNKTFINVLSQQLHDTMHRTVVKVWPCVATTVETLQFQNH